MGPSDLSPPWTGSASVTRRSREPRMRRVASILAFALTTAATVHGAQSGVALIYDPRPEPGVPREARWAGTRPDPDSKPGARSNISFRIVDDLRDYGALRKVVSADIHVITVRYYGASFRDLEDVQAYLTSVLRSDKGSTNAYCPWAEALSLPDVEATIQFTSGARGRWLLWRQGRSVYQDPDMRWWFSHGW